MQIGDRIAKRRKELGLTQDELAARTGYKSKAAISKIETNVNDITQSMVVKFADVLDTTVGYLMGWDEIAEDPVLQKQHEEINELFDRLPPELRTHYLALLKGLAQASAAPGDPKESD